GAPQDHHPGSLVRGGPGQGRGQLLHECPRQRVQHFGSIERQAPNRSGVVLDQQGFLRHLRHRLLVTTSASTATHPSGPATNGFTSSASSSSPRSSASRDNLVMASATASRSAGGVPR